MRNDNEITKVQSNTRTDPVVGVRLTEPSFIFRPGPVEVVFARFGGVTFLDNLLKKAEIDNSMKEFFSFYFEPVTFSVTRKYILKMNIWVVLRRSENNKLMTESSQSTFMQYKVF